jgi:hypothetical protein
MRPALSLCILITAALLFQGRQCLAQSYIASGLGGASGMVSTPTAKIAWEDADLAIDAGYHFIASAMLNHIPKITISFLKQAELGFAYDYQSQQGNDYLFHVKWNFYNAGNAALALGSNVQVITRNRNSRPEPFGQVYIAFTYLGSLFSMPVQTSVAFGKTLGKGQYNSDLDVSLGFGVNLFPEFLKHHVHWINDFANYSYSVDPGGSSHYRRGAYSTGFRLAVFNTDERVKLNFDLIMSDFFDEGDRSFSIGTVFGYAIL